MSRTDAVIADTPPPAPIYIARTWLELEINSWLRSGNPPSLLIMGPPGTGKSRLLGAIARRAFPLSVKEELPLGFAMLRDREVRVDGLRWEVLRRNLLELAERFGAPADVSGSSTISVNVRANRSSDVKTHVTPQQFTSREEPIDDFYSNVLPRLNQMSLNHPTLIVIDGLDEAAREPGSESFVEVVAALSLEISRSHGTGAPVGNLRLLMTSQPESPLASMMESHRILDLSEFAALDKEPLEAYAIQALPDAGNTLISALARQAAGRWSWMTLAIAALGDSELGDLTESAIDGLPIELNAMYGDCVQRLRARHQSDAITMSTVLGLLTASFELSETLSVDEIGLLLGVGRPAVLNIALQLSALCLVREDELHFRYPDFAVWLLSNPDLNGLDLLSSHVALRDIYTPAPGHGWADLGETPRRRSFAHSLVALERSIGRPSFRAVRDAAVAILIDEDRLAVPHSGAAWIVELAKRRHHFRVVTLVRDDGTSIDVLPILPDLLDWVENTVGSSLSEGMNPDELSEFEKLVDDGKEDDAFEWLAERRPTHRDVVTSKHREVLQQLRTGWLPPEIAIEQEIRRLTDDAQRLAPIVDLNDLDQDVVRSSISILEAALLLNGAEGGSAVGAALMEISARLVWLGERGDLDAVTRNIAVRRRILAKRKDRSGVLNARYRLALALLIGSPEDVSEERRDEAIEICRALEVELDTDGRGEEDLQLSVLTLLSNTYIAMSSDDAEALDNAIRVQERYCGLMASDPDARARADFILIRLLTNRATDTDKEQALRLITQWIDTWGETGYFEGSTMRSSAFWMRRRARFHLNNGEIEQAKVDVKSAIALHREWFGEQLSAATILHADQLADLVVDIYIEASSEAEIEGIAADLVSLVQTLTSSGRVGKDLSGPAEQPGGPRTRSLVALCNLLGVLIACGVNEAEMRGRLVQACYTASIVAADPMLRRVMQMAALTQKLSLLHPSNQPLGAELIHEGKSLLEGFDAEFGLASFTQNSRYECIMLIRALSKVVVDRHAFSRPDDLSLQIWLAEKLYEFRQTAIELVELSELLTKRWIIDRDDSDIDHAQDLMRKYLSDDTNDLEDQEMVRAALAVALFASLERRDATAILTEVRELLASLTRAYTFNGLPTDLRRLAHSLTPDNVVLSI